MADQLSRIALVGCSAQKLDTKVGVPARELYTSDLFRKSLAYAEATCSSVWIISAFHGAIRPDEKLHSYDRKLSDIGGKREREAWGQRVVDRVTMRAAPSQLVVLAGKDYLEAVRAGWHWYVRETWPEPLNPLKGLGIGVRKAWLARETNAAIEASGGCPQCVAEQATGIAATETHVCDVDTDVVDGYGR